MTLLLRHSEYQFYAYFRHAIKGNIFNLYINRISNLRPAVDIQTYINVKIVSPVVGKVFPNCMY
jgi:hypothetical protein